MYSAHIVYAMPNFLVFYCYYLAGHIMLRVVIDEVAIVFVLIFYYYSIVFIYSGLFLSAGLINSMLLWFHFKRILDIYLQLAIIFHGCNIS